MPPSPEPASSLFSLECRRVHRILPRPAFFFFKPGSLIIDGPGGPWADASPHFRNPGLKGDPQEAGDCSDIHTPAGSRPGLEHLCLGPSSWQADFLPFCSVGWFVACFCFELLPSGLPCWSWGCRDILDPGGPCLGRCSSSASEGLCCSPLTYQKSPAPPPPHQPPWKQTLKLGKKKKKHFSLCF